jgi:hypothetical protein
LLEPSMYSEKKSSVGVADALETDRMSGSAATAVTRTASRRLRHGVEKGTADFPQVRR